MVTQEFADRGLLDGNVAVYMAAADEPDYETDVKPVLDELGIEPVEVGINDAPTDDTAASEAAVRLIAERFKAADVDTILLVGIGATAWMADAMDDDTSYRPQLLFTEANAARSFYTSADTTDTSILEGALVGGGYGPDQARFDEPTFQECVADPVGRRRRHAGTGRSSIPTIASNQPYQAAFQACPDIWLTKALLTRAGENLNYGTLAAAVDGLDDDDPRRSRPSAPTARRPTTATRPAYIFKWDEATKSVVLDEG